MGPCGRRMLVFGERGKPEYPEKNLSEQEREPTNSAHMRHRIGESNPGHIGGRRVLSPLRHPCSPNVNLYFGPTTWALVFSDSKGGGSWSIANIFSFLYKFYGSLYRITAISLRLFPEWSRKIFEFGFYQRS